MKKLFLLFFINSFSYSQEIAGGPLSPDLNNILPNTLTELYIKTNEKVSNIKVSNINWLALTIDNDEIITVPGYTDTSNNHFILSSTNALIICNLSIDNKPLSLNLKLSPFSLDVTKKYLIVKISKVPIIDNDSVLIKQLSPNLTYILNKADNTPYKNYIQKTNSTLLIVNNQKVIHTAPYPSNLVEYLSKYLKK